MKKAISIFTALTTVLWLSGLFMIFPVHAVDFADGDLVREADEFDVYIVKLAGVKKFKRLILNPDVFNMYGHLNWADIQVVADGELADYTVSELIRADGDEKVYKLFPDGDVGTKKWVDSLDCFTTQGFDWDSVYVINTFDRDSYTTASTTMCEEGVVAGDITLSLAADTPDAANLPNNAEGVPFLKVNIAGSGTISQMVFKRIGVGEADDFANVYLYEGSTRLTSGRSISSSTSKVTFIGLSVTAPTTLTLVGDLSSTSATTGNVNAFSLVAASDVTSAATVGGTFPIEGNGLTITSVTGGTLTVALTGSVGNPTVGEQDALVTQFKITADNEIINLERFTVYNGGNMNSTEMTNLELKTGGVVVATADTFASNDLATFVFDPPFVMEKGTTDIFKMYADLAGDKDDTIKLYCEVDADVSGVGQTYGHNAAVTITAFDGSTAGTDYHSLTLQGGELTVAFNGPIAADVGNDTDDTVLLDLSYTAAVDLEIRRTTFYVCWNDNADLVAGHTMLLAEAEMNDIKLKDKDTGTILMGPTDGSNFTTTTDNGSLAVCTEGTYEGEIGHEWTDMWDLAAGTTMNVQLTIDIESSTYVAADDAFSAILYGYENTSTAVKYTGTNNYVASTDIVPSTNIEGNDMTVKVSTIDVALGALPTGNVNAVKGEAGIEAAALIFTAGDASDMELTDLVLTVFVDDDGSGYSVGRDDTDTTLYGKNIVNNVTLYESDGTTKISGGGPKSFSDGTYDEDATFDNLSWNIPAGESKKMIVAVDITTTATSGDYDYIAIEIDAAANVTAVDDQGTSRNSTSTTINDNEAVRVVKYDGGTLTSAEAADGVRRSATYVYQGQTGAETSMFKFTSTREAFLIDKVRLSTEATGELKYFSKIELSYPVDADGTLVSVKPSQYFASLASITFDLTGKEMYVPKDDYAYLTVYADYSGYNDAGDTAAVDFGIDLEADDADDFHATGVGSSRVIEGGESTNGIIADQNSSEHMYIKRTFPSFTLDQSTGGVVTSMAQVTKVLEFTITNNGNYDMVFNNTSGQLAFDILGSGELTPDCVFSLYKGDGTLIEDEAESNTSGMVASMSFDFDDALTSITIPENGSQAFYIKIKSGATQWDETGDWLQLELDNLASVVKWKDGADETVSSYVVDLKYLGIPLEGPVWNVNTN